MAGLIGVLLIAGLPSSGGAEPFAFTQAVQPVSANHATLNGMTVPNGLPTTTWFEWGTTLGYGQTTPVIDAGDGAAVVRINATVTNLLPGRIYHSRLVCSNVAGVRFGFDQPFVVAGRAVTWGQSEYSQPGVAASQRDVVGLAAGGEPNLALHSDGLLTSWGRNSFGQTNVPSGLSNVCAVASGGTFSMALKANGTVTAWGSNTYVRNVAAGLSNVIAVAAGHGHAMALRSNGTVTVWGDNSYGQTNVPSGLTNVVAIASGISHCLALRADGTIRGWGANANGQASAPTGLSNVVAVAGGGSYSMALQTDGTVLLWTTTTNIRATNGIAISAYDTYSAVLKSDGSVSCWGAVNVVPPTNLPPVVAVFAGMAHETALVLPRAFVHTQPAQPVTTNSAVLNAMVTPNGLPTTVWFEWGADGTYGQTTSPVQGGDGVSVVHLSVPLNQLAASAVYHYRAVASNELGVVRGANQCFTTGRRVAAWGMSAAGLPLPPAGLGDVIQIASGDFHGLALKPDGTVAVWGYYLPDTSFLPVAPVPGNMTDVIAIAGGRDHSVALRSDGSVVAWGDNTSGQTNVPSDLTNVIAISAGDVHTLALQADGLVRGWGKFGYFNSWPVGIPVGLSNVVAISSGDTHCEALKDDGTVVCWGYNDSGQLSVPPDLANVTAIAAGWQYSMALKADRKVVGWGLFRFGQPFYLPSNLTNVIAIASGDSICLALKGTGDVILWGSSYFGPLTQPAGLSNAVAVAGGDQLCFALAPNLVPKASSLSVTGAMNMDWVVGLKSSDPNGDATSYRISALPTAGDLFQYTETGCGASIEAVDTPVTDVGGRVIFAPALDEFGVPYSSFGFVANDGALDSAPATVSVNVIPKPELSVGVMNSDGSISLTFAGVSNAAYRVWTSTNFVNWTLRGTATQPQPGRFLFTDATASNAPYRFYRVTSP